MKKKSTIILELLLLFLCQNSFAQNWTIINPGYKYNYSTRDLKFENTKTIYVDSIDVLGSDSIFYLNRVFVKINKGTYEGIDTIITNSPQFLQRKIKKKTNGDLLLSDPSELLLKTHCNIGDSWTFDSVNNISAQLISINYDTVFGIYDSIKKIVLSSSDTIIFSKNYGLIKYSTSYLDTNKYYLKGIEGLNIGLQTPKYHDFFNFSIGDVFDYHRYYSHEAPTSYSEYKGNWDIRYTILSKNTYGDTIRYEVNILQKAVLWSRYGNTFDTSYENFNSTINYIYNNNSCLNFFNNELKITGSQYNEISFVFDTIFNAIGKKVMSSSNVYYVGGDTIRIIFDWGGLTKFARFLYAKERGEINYHSYEREYPSAKTIDSTLVGCKLSGIVYGILKPDSFYINNNILPTPGNSPRIFPNPARTELTIETSPLNPEGTVIICDINGTEMLTRQIRGSKTQINIQSLKSGIYFVKLITENNVELKKIVKE